MINLFYILLLIFFIFLVYISGRNNKTNLWCVCSGAFLTLGVVKEFFMYQIVPHFIRGGVLALSINTYEKIYSVMTWMLYVFAMSSAVIFAMNFSDLPRKNFHLYRLVQTFLVVCIFVITVLYHPLSFRRYQVSDIRFWYVLSAYNLLLGVIFVFMAVQGIRKERNRRARKQKFLISLIILPPVIYWLITIFVFHPLRLTRFFKVWQGNIVILFFCVILYIYMASKEGLMGLKLNIENFQWTSGADYLSDSAELTVHMLKNYTVKLRWCLENLKQYFKENNSGLPPELDIMERSIKGISNYCERTQKYAQNITLIEKWIPSAELLYGLDRQYESPDFSLQIRVISDIQICCDPVLIREVLLNLLQNASDAVADSVKRGTINISDCRDEHTGDYYICVKDNGPGMDEKQVVQIFRPYYTTKNVETNFGLGLPYCRKVMEKHSGKITVESTPGSGSIFTLCFPAKRIKEMGNNYESHAR